MLGTRCWELKLGTKCWEPDAANFFALDYPCGSCLVLSTKSGRVIYFLRLPPFARAGFDPTTHSFSLYGGMAAVDDTTV
jgi:hypothetical protein